MSIVEETHTIPTGSPFGPIQFTLIRQGRSDDYLSIGVVRTILPDDWDPNNYNARDGQWHAVITLPHEIVDYEGYAVPAFEGDRERIEWERQRKSRY